MRIHAVSFLSKNRNLKEKKDLNYPFLYTASHIESKSNIKNYGIITGISAITAVGVTLYNLKRTKRIPKDIVEIANLEKGLNKLTGFQKTINELKSKFLYPLKCAVINGKENPKKFKSGIIFINESDEPTTRVMNAFLEHLNELEIDTVNINTIAYKTNNNGQKYLKELKRNEIVKEVFSEVQKAEEKFANEGKYSVINLGNLEKLTRLKAVKSQKSNIEQLLEDISNNKYKGVLWAAESTNHESLPLFFTDLPVLITKLMD